jgi:hypothetical protein
MFGGHPCSARVLIGWAICGAIGWGAHGCGPMRPQPTTPEGVTREFAIALSQTDYQHAYELMDASYRARIDFMEFQERLSDDAEETFALANALSHATPSTETEGVLTYEEDRTLRLKPSGRTWRIATDVTLFYDQSTPRATLDSFLRAMEKRRYNVVMRFIPIADKKGVTPDLLSEYWSKEGRQPLERLISSLRDNRQAPIEEVGDLAVMPYGGRCSLQFRRENGLWKIESLQ